MSGAAQLMVDERVRSQGVFGDADEAALFAAVRARDQDAFAELVRRYGALLHQVAWRVLGDRVASEDLVQEALLKLWRRPRWRPDGGAKLSTWLYRVTLNAAIDARRRQRRREPELSLEEAPQALTDAAEPDQGLSTLQREQLMQKIRRLMDDLPARQRQALILCYFEELTHPQAAAVMGVSTKAVETLNARGRKTLAARCRELNIFVEDLQ